MTRSDSGDVTDLVGATEPPPGALEYVRRLIEQEQKRKETLDQRGTAAITTAAALLAILLSVRAGLLKAQVEKYSDNIRLALLFVAISIGFAIASALLTFSSSPKVKDVKGWARGEIAPDDTPLEHDLADLGTRRLSNGIRIWLVSLAQLFQCAVVAVLMNLILRTL